ncbi:MAG: hypothetical protein GXP27_19770 [Planctomycetes bacterium]|nr:hypothetical protein [Planctomycetota bacterium]
MAEFQRQLDELKRMVTLGRWKTVKERLGKFRDDEPALIYDRMIATLASSTSRSVGAPSLPAPSVMPGGVASVGAVIGMGAPPPGGAGPPGATRGRRGKEQNVFAPEDVIGLLLAAPKQLTDSQIKQLGRIAASAVAAGAESETIASMLRELLGRDDAPPWLDAPLLVELFFAGGLSRYVEPLLPPLAEAIREKNLNALNHWCRFLEDRYRREGKRSDLEKTWEVTQTLLAAGTTDDEETNKALRRCVELAQKLEKELGMKWLEDSFTEEPQRGIAVLAAIGTFYRDNWQAWSQTPDRRRKALTLQKTAVEALIQAAPQRADQWQATLQLLALNWFEEANLAFHHQTRGYRQLRFDAYGNPYYIGYASPSGSRRQPQPILITDLLECAPSDQWTKRLSAALRPSFQAMRARLLMKIGEEEDAFELIRPLAGTHRELTKKLVEQFLAYWTQNHRLNNREVPRNPFMVYYGFNPRGDAIPLTRSKQNRNMDELAHWVKKLRELNLGEIDDRLLIKAFTEAHSVAEVYRLETIERVFGPLQTIEPTTVAELVQKMRSNLSNVWRDPRVQQREKTKRRKKDIEAEVRRGYALAIQVVDRALSDSPNHWALIQAKAALLIDQANYEKEIGVSGSSYAERRSEAMRLFARAADAYAKALPDLPKEKQTAEVYQQWFYAALGSADIRGIHPDKPADLKQIPLIAASLETLDPAARQYHRDKFASSLYTRLASVNPGSKFMFLKAGFQIVGDHPLARDARRLYEYYQDLVTEIELHARIDGHHRVGHTEPFGVLVEIRHTKEIEREAGGFAKYTTNQRSYYYSFNYGRPLQNYRDKFEEAVHAALDEDFEVLSITFNSKDAHSKSDPEREGWRVTPYAYLLLKAKGAHVDRLPPLRLEMDFLDTSGYVVLPIESPQVPLDASERLAGRPPENLTIAQTLDERQAKDGKLLLEVKATGHGVIPPLDELLELSPDGFRRVATEDQGVSVSEFDQESERTVVLCERLWVVTFQAVRERDQMPHQFAFGQPKVPVKEMDYQRYVDEDLVSVEPVAKLEWEYGQPRRPWWAIARLAAGSVVTVILIMAAIVWRRRKRPRPTTAFRRPERLTPFTCIGLLRHIQRDGELPAGRRQELERAIADLEQRFFASGDGADVDLNATVEFWLKEVRTG